MRVYVKVQKYKHTKWKKKIKSPISFKSQSFAVVVIANQGMFDRNKALWFNFLLYFKYIFFLFINY